MARRPAKSLLTSGTHLYDNLCCMDQMRGSPKWIGDEVERLKNNVMLMCVGEVVV